jgi:hypothetical protein
MIIQKTANEIIIRLPRSINIEDLQEITDYLRYLEISSKKQTSQNEVDLLVNEVKSGRWLKTREQLLNEGGC